MIPLDDRGLLLGDGLFETMLAVDGAIARLDAHLDRLIAGCAVLGLPAPDRVEARTLCEATLVGTGAGRAAVRLTLTAGSGGRGLDRPDAPVPRLVAAAAPASPPSGSARLVAATVRRNEGSPAARLKTLAYVDNVLARAEARAVGADEAVMLNNRGDLACAAAANLFWIAGGRLFTPALDCGVLAGLTRAGVLAAARVLGVAVEETAAPLAALDAAEAVFLTNSLIGVRPAVWSGRDAAAHPLVARLATAV